MLLRNVSAVDGGGGGGQVFARMNCKPYEQAKQPTVETTRSEFERERESLDHCPTAQSFVEIDEI